MKAETLNNLWDKVEEKEADETEGQTERSPVMSLLEDSQGISVHLDVSVEIHLAEGCHRDFFLVAVLDICRMLEGHVVFDGTVGDDGLAGARADGGGNEPDSSGDGDCYRSGQNEVDDDSSSGAEGEVEHLEYDDVPQCQALTEGRHLGCGALDGEQEVQEIGEVRSYLQQIPLIIA